MPESSKGGMDGALAHDTHGLQDRVCAYKMRNFPSRSLTPSNRRSRRLTICGKLPYMVSCQIRQVDTGKRRRRSYTPYCFGPLCIFDHGFSWFRSLDALDAAWLTVSGGGCCRRGGQRAHKDSLHEL